MKEVSILQNYKTKTHFLKFTKSKFLYVPLYRQLYLEKVEIYTQTFTKSRKRKFLDIILNRNSLTLVPLFLLDTRLSISTKM